MCSIRSAATAASRCGTWLSVILENNTVQSTQLQHPEVVLHFPNAALDRNNRQEQVKARMTQQN